MRVQIYIYINSLRDLPVKSEIRINSDVRLGSFLLGPELKDKFTNFIQFTSGERPAYSHPIKVHMGLYYHSSSIWNPQIGDLRVQFSFAGATDTFVRQLNKKATSIKQRNLYLEFLFISD